MGDPRSPAQIHSRTEFFLLPAMDPEILPVGLSIYEYLPQIV